MYEVEDLSQILQNLLDAIPVGINKRPGEITYDILSAVSQEFARAYELQYWLEQNFSPSTMDMEHLTLWSQVYGLSPYPASQARVTAEFTVEPETLEIAVGTRFTGGGNNYVVESKLDKPKQYTLVCETAGVEGNAYYGLIQPVYNINGLKRAEIVEISIPGEDIEDLEDYRERIQNNFSAKAFGGNYADYYQDVIGLQGVGGLKVVGTPSRKATYVDIYIIDSEFKQPTEETVQSIQEAVHPRPKDLSQDTLETSGTGLAPIGHDVTVHGVRNKEIDIKTHISLNDGYQWETVQESVKKTITDYFLSLAKTWASNDKITVRVSNINSQILDVDGVIDVWETTINEDSGHLDLEFDEIPTLKEITNLEGE